MFVRKYLLLLVCMFFLPIGAWAQSLRHLTSANGLTSSAVFSVSVDSDGFAWIGQPDGLYVSAGNDFKPAWFQNGNASLDGHVVNGIVFSDAFTLWAQSSHGLMKINRLEARVTSFPQFDGTYQAQPAPDDGLLVLDKNSNLHLYRKDLDSFVDLRLPRQIEGALLNVASSDSCLWTFGSQGIFRYPWISDDAGRIGLDTGGCIDSFPVEQFVRTGDTVFLCGPDGILCSFNLLDGCKEPLRSIKQELSDRGTLSGVVEMDENLFLSFEKGGVVRWDRSDVSAPMVDLGIRSGVFHLFRDKRQDIIWIATDGEGIYQYIENPFQITSHLSEEIGPSLDKPIRAIFEDRNGVLWLGTKGAGLFAVDRHSYREGVFQNSTRYTVQNSPLKDNSVYALSAASDGGIWIGSDGGVDYYDPFSRSFRSVVSAEPLPYIHGIQESDESTLWMTSVGYGIFVAEIRRERGMVYLEKIRHYTLDNGTHSSNYFFCMSESPDGKIWFGNRGSGLYQMTTAGLVSVPTSIGKTVIPANDVFAVFARDSVTWAGTGAGLVGLTPDGSEIYINKNNGLTNNTIHALLQDSARGVWIATNDGLARLRPDLKDIDLYGRKKGLRVNEFSDGAAFLSPSALYFGGVDGWVEVRQNPSFRERKEFVPAVVFTYLALNGQELNLFSMTRSGDGSVRMNAGDNSFTVQYEVTDSVDEDHYDFYYQLSSQSPDQWISNGARKAISFFKIHSGDYRLSVKAINRQTGVESPPASFMLHIAAPWYATWWMKMIWWILCLGLVGILVMDALRRNKRKNLARMEKVEQAHKEELYEEKLRFFTNVTHEFCTPLTLIYSPCERILSHTGVDDYVRRYVTVIRDNAVRLNALIQEIIDYRRLETKHQTYKLVRMDLGALTRKKTGAFVDVAFERGIRLEEDIETPLMWNMDDRCYDRILTNLLSNALKYTPSGGVIRVNLHQQGDELILRVYNTGKGIKEEDRVSIFDSYRVLDNIEKDSMEGLSSRNGLGLAICNSMTELLQGKIEVTSEEGAWAEFIVTLPLLPESDPDAFQLNPHMPEVTHDLRKETQLPETQPGAPSDSAPTVLIVDDHPEILGMLREALGSRYKIETASDGDAALEQVKNNPPDLIITDIMMPGKDGLSLTRQLKGNKHTMQIPLIILSAKNSVEDQTAGLLSGGDAYVTKPFKISYLDAVISRLLNRDAVMKEYYGTSASAYGYAEGKLMTVEDRQFVLQMTEWVEENLGGEITAEQMASHFNMSLRSLYRRFKELDLAPPRDFIRERKMNRAARLLQTSDMTVQEVIYACGFNNRPHFYKEFEKLYGMTPKEYRQQNKVKDESL